MKTEFKSSFVKDLRGIKSRKIHERVKALIELVESVEDLSAITDLKKLHGAGTYFRVRVGEYRVGLTVQADLVTFVRCLNRKEIYRFFP